MQIFALGVAGLRRYISFLSTRAFVRVRVGPNPEDLHGTSGTRTGLWPSWREVSSAHMLLANLSLHACENDDDLANSKRPHETSPVVTFLKYFNKLGEVHMFTAWLEQ